MCLLGTLGKGSLGVLKLLVSSKVANPWAKARFWHEMTRIVVKDRAPVTR